MKPCTLGKRHKWDFVKNTMVRRETIHTVHLAQVGIYACACGLRKQGPMGHEEEVQP